MKILNFINTRNFLATLMILAGCMTSCEKEKNEELKGSLEFTNYKTQGGGDEEEDPIIQGVALDTYDTPIANATIRLIDNLTSNVMNTKITDVNGKFIMTAEQGEYFFTVETNNTVVTTSSFQLSQNTTVTIRV